MVKFDAVWRPALAFVLAAAIVAVVYEANVTDSKSVAPPASETGPLVPGASSQFEATAYCKGHTTASGVGVRAGIAASDPEVLPLGSVIQVDGVAEPYRGIYTVLDTGPEVQGREIDIYIWSCYEALEFGRRPVDVTVLRLGWSQTATAAQLK